MSSSFAIPIEAPVDGEYVITGQVTDANGLLPVGSKLPMDSPLRSSSELLARELRVKRLRLVPAGERKAVESPSAKVETTTTRKKRK